MLTAAENERLTRTGPETPMGRYFRSFPLPVALSEELPGPDCPPIRVRVLGECLLAFRDSEGRVGLIEPRCPHRGADLYWGRNEGCGIRCVYHGWKFDVRGRAMELPNVPPGSRYHDEMRIRAWPVEERGGMLWATLGVPFGADGEPAGALPPVPALEANVLPPAHCHVTKKLQLCNWAQALEGALDTSHFSFLHMPAPGVASNENPDAPADERRLRWIRDDPMPRFELIEHEVGFVVGGARRGEEGERYWRITQFLLPAHATTPSTLPGETHFGYTFVPRDDESCWIFTYAWNPERPIGEEERARFRGGHGVMPEVGPDYVPVRNLWNEYLIDREAQRERTFTGVRGVAEQDAMIQESQGPIVDRTREHLTPTDAAIVRFRRLLLGGAGALEKGEPPAAPWRADAYRVRSGSAFAPEGMPLEAVMEARFGDRTGRVRAAEEPRGREGARSRSA